MPSFETDIGGSKIGFHIPDLEELTIACLGLAVLKDLLEENPKHAMEGISEYIRVFDGDKEAALKKVNAIAYPLLEALQSMGGLRSRYDGE